jgi:hypothetical protein
MKETKKKYSDFLSPDFSMWINFDEVVKRYEQHLIRVSFGGNKAIHKL